MGQADAGNLERTQEEEYQLCGKREAVYTCAVIELRELLVSLQHLLNVGPHNVNNLRGGSGEIGYPVLRR